MDPLSGAANVIAVVGAIITTIKASHAMLSGLQDAPKALQTLARELMGSKAVSENVMVVSKLNTDQTQSTDPTVTAASSAIPSPSSTFSDHIRHPQSIVPSVDDLIEGSTTVPASKQTSVKRVGWMIQGKRIMKMRDQVASVKLNISVLLIFKTLHVTTWPKYRFCPWKCMTDACSFRYQLSSLDLRIARFEAMSTPRHQEVMILLQRSLQ